MISKHYTAIDELVKKHNEMKYRRNTSSKEFDISNSSLEGNELETPIEQKTSPKEVDKYITPRSNTIKLPPDLKKIGIKTKDDDQFSEAMNKIRFPISDERIMEDLKAPPTESRRWFATILLYILERAHITLKKVGTHTVRFLKTK